MNGRKNHTPVHRLASLTGVLFLLTFGIVLLFLLDPIETRFFPHCPFFALTGLKCPGCGTARALHAVLHGRFTEALCFNAVLPAMLVILAYCLAFPRHAQRAYVVWTLLVFIVAWWVIRNVIGI